MKKYMGIIVAALVLSFTVTSVTWAGGARFAVFADPHFYDTALGTSGQAFETYLMRDRKMLRESEAILDAAIKSIIRKRPDFVIIPGDLTKDGALSSHKKFAGHLASLEKAGIKVYVCPGNHDVNNPHAFAFDGDQVTPVPNVSPAAFAAVYDDFGYAEALEHGPGSLSYLAEPVPGVWLLAIDSCRYQDNTILGHPETQGEISPETMDWLLEKLAEARDLDKQVIGFMHHGVTEHYQGQSVAFEEYVVMDWQHVAGKLASAGLKMVFTGHYHANDITRHVPENGGPSLYDVETGSLVTYPSPFRLVSLSRDKAAIHTEYVTQIPRRYTGGVPFPGYAENFLSEGLIRAAIHQLTTRYGLPQARAEQLAPMVARAFAAHYSGDEQPDPATMDMVFGLLESPDPTTQFLGRMLYALWTDLAPADTHGQLDLGAPIRLSVAGTHATGIFDDGAAEIVAHDPETQRLFVANGATNTIDVLDGTVPDAPAKRFEIPLALYGGGVNSVAVKNGVVAAAVQADPKQDAGSVVFFDTAGQYLNQVTVGALPDMLVFTPDGQKVLVANEGEPDDDYTSDPEGSVSIIDISAGVAAATVRHAGFGAFIEQAAELKARGVRIYGPGASVAQDMEPEYIAVAADSLTAWVACQENNAVAVLDVVAGVITGIFPLGYKDHGLPVNGLDASNKDDAINISPYANVFGMFQPDALAAFESNGQTFLITANEGDSRDYDGFSEEERIKDLILDPTVFPDSASLQHKSVLGRLKVTTTLGDTDGDNDYDALYAYGGRSFSIFKPTATGLDLVFDSKDQFERITAAMLPMAFNSTNDENDSFDNRSDDKGPEPEGVTVGEIDGRTYAFIGLERMGGIMVYEVTDPAYPRFVQYINNRDYTGDAEAGTAGDLAPEGLTFIPSDQSPVDTPLLAVANEVSGTTTLYTIEKTSAPIPGDLDGNGQVDRVDMAVIMFHRNQPAQVCPAADLDQDGNITVRDARKLMRLFMCKGGICR